MKYNWLIASMAMWMSWFLPPASGVLNAQCPHSSAEIYGLEQSYDAGEFYQIANRHQCVRELFDATRPAIRPTNELLTVTEKFLHLYVLSNIALDRDAEANAATIMLLKRFPMHKFDPGIDPPQLKEIFDLLHPYAANNFGLYGGGNLSLLQVQTPSTVFDDITVGGPLRAGPTFRPLSRATFGMEWQHHFAYRQSLILGLGVQGLGFSAHFASRNFSKSTVREGDWSLTQSEKYNFLQIPVRYQYRIPLSMPSADQHFWLGIQAGAFVNLLLQASSNIVSEDWVLENGSDLIAKTNKSTIASPADRRQHFGTGLVAALSLQADIGRFSYFARMGGEWGLSQMRLPGSEYNNSFQEYIWQFQFSDQNFKFHCLQFTVGALLARSYNVKNLSHP